VRLEDITVEVRDINLNRVGAIRPEDLDLTAEVVANNVGTWTLTLPFEHPMVPHLRTPGSGLIVTGPTDVLFSGPTVKPNYESTPQDPAGTVVVEGITDEHILQDYLCYPDPSNPDSTTQGMTNDVRTGARETLMHTYVKRNIGSLAPAGRRNTKLINGTDLGRGGTVTKSPRFRVVGNLLEELAAKGDLGFRVVQRGSNLVFETFASVDRTATVRLSTNNGQLAGQKVSIAVPGVTRVIVAGKNQGTDRSIVERTNSTATTAEAAWGRRIERFVDQRSTEDLAELSEAGDEILAEEGLTLVSAQAVPAEDTTMRFGRHWFLGDLVRVVLEDQEVAAIVTSVILSANADGFRMGVTLGETQGFSARATYAKRQRALESRVAQIEQNVEVGPGGSGGSGVIGIDGGTPDSTFITSIDGGTP
jgi:hypothetical protein